MKLTVRDAKGIHLTPEAMPIIAELSSKGARERDIARALSMTPPTWRKIKEHDALALEALERGRSEWHARLMHDLSEPECHLEGVSVQQGIALMRQKSINAMFVLKCRFGYREQGVDEQPLLNVQINLPANASVEKFGKLVSKQ